MRKTIRKSFKGFKHDIVFEFIVNTHASFAELAYLKTMNPKLDRTQICSAHVMFRGLDGKGKLKRVSFSPVWPILPFYAGVVEELSGDDRYFVRWRDTAFDIINSRLSDFRDMILRDETDKHNFNDLEDLREDFIPWQIDRIIKTGNVEEGAEVVLQTREGQDVLQRSIEVVGPLTPGLKKKIKQSVDHKNKLLKQHIKEIGGTTNRDQSTHRE